VTDVDYASGETVVADVHRAGGEAIYLHQGVTDEARWFEVIGAVEKRLGHLNVMMTNAAPHTAAEHVPRHRHSLGHQPAADAGWRNEPTDTHALSRSFVPLARAGEAQNVADGVLFLASAASGYMTGAELVIDGDMFGGMRRQG
jgi:NAD(P)-dependent dehydrogenase (short-subunit alcohol dehydrogenase family)